MRRKINELRRDQDTMMWEKQRVSLCFSGCHPQTNCTRLVMVCTHLSVAFYNLQLRNEMSDRTNDVQKVTCQIRNCESKLHLATQRLDILNQRPRLELCLDKVSYTSSMMHRNAQMTFSILRCYLCGNGTAFTFFTVSPPSALLQPHTGAS